jgi:hypothetical protein
LVRRLSATAAPAAAGMAMIRMKSGVGTSGPRGVTALGVISAR